jgi:K+-sensing histidine kinase KdpD
VTGVQTCALPISKEEGDGTGLGLSVSYGIVTAHGGMIEVPHTSAEGTTFRVRLPMAGDPVAPEPGFSGAAMLRGSGQVV